MKKSLIFWILLLCLALGGCGRTETEAPETTAVPETTEATVPATVPQDGNPEDMTCLGSYTNAGSHSALVAQMKGAYLTNDQLAVWYWAEAASYRQSGRTPAPDFDKPLDTQICEIDDTVGSWQQYFLREALNRWHTAEALAHQGGEEGLPVEEAHNPDPEKYEYYLENIPATKYLYRYEKSYTPNTMHQAYLDALPELLTALAEEAGFESEDALAREVFGTTAANLEHWAHTYNAGYLYFTNLTYFLELSEEDLPAQEETGEKTVSIRQLLVTRNNGSEELLKRVDNWKDNWHISEGEFADLARKYSEDPGTYTNGGAYRDLKQGQLRPELESWCFDENRKIGDITCIQTEDGYHILFFCGSEDSVRTAASRTQTEQAQEALLAAAREKYPMEVSYEKISLPEGQALIAYEQILYPDIAHERFPEVPLYLQVNYIGTRYGNYPLNTHGCGITSMAMLASYMTDQELTPAVLAKRYGRYCYQNGTDGSLFVNEPPVLGFYLKEKTFDYKTAKQALQDGYIVVVSQSKGYWTRGGHFLVLEKIDENDMVTVRDSNIFNYQKIPGFKEDCHPWKTLVSTGKAFWVFEKKVVPVPACTRCGEGSAEETLIADYTCEKCTPAILRRDCYLAG